MENQNGGSRKGHNGCEQNGSRSAKEKQICPIYRVHRGVLGKGEHKYEQGIFYRSSFKVTGGPIYLQQVGFFGPQKACEFELTVEVNTALWSLTSSCFDPFFPCFAFGYQKEDLKFKQYATTTTSGTTKPEEILYVNFEPVVHIPDNKWIEILFSWYKMSERLPVMDVYNRTSITTLKTEDGDRTLVFCAGSSQMPIMEFAVKNPLDY